MPRIPDEFADCSIYFYESALDATEGSRTGGCGFLAHVPSEIHPGTGYLYFVTNKHVVDPRDGNCNVIRVTRKTGGIDTIVTTFDAWFTHPGGDDIAVLPLDIPPETLAGLKWWSVPSYQFITHETINAYRIGIGDEAFMIGRLVNHEGRQKNAAVARFGNIALMADASEPIRHTYGMFEGFLVECRSLSGFSGSPVFVMTTQVYRGEDAEKVVKFRAGNQIPREAIRDGKEQRFPGQIVVQSIDLTNAGPWLLGIDWGHTPLYRPVERGGIPDVSLRVELNTGIACVSPAWKIMDVLNTEELVKQRRDEDQRIKARKERESTTVNDVANNQQVFTKDDFEDALKKASRKLSGQK